MAGTAAGAAKRKYTLKRKPATTRASAKRGNVKRKTPARRAKR